jgi:hypothetical protein
MKKAISGSKTAEFQSFLLGSNTPPASPTPLQACAFSNGPADGVSTSRPRATPNPDHRRVGKAQQLDHLPQRLGVTSPRRRNAEHAGAVGG